MTQPTSSSRTLIVLVNWRRPEDTLACIASLLGQTVQAFDVALCDNCSPGDSDAQFQAYFTSAAGHRGITAIETAHYGGCLGKLSNGSGFIYVRSHANLGFAGGNNLAYHAAREQMAQAYDHVWFLNNDTEVEPDSLALMLDKFRRNPKLGICGCTLVYAFDHKTVQVLGGSRYTRWSGLMQELGNGSTLPVQVDEAVIESQMSYVAGASMLVSAALIASVGLMAEDYFLYFEELDLAERAMRHGFELGYAAKAVVYHKEGAAIGTGTGNRRSLLAEYYGLRNKLIVTRRFFPWALPTVWVISWLQAARRLMLGRPENATLMARTLIGLGRSPA